MFSPYIISIMFSFLVILFTEYIKDCYGQETGIDFSLTGYSVEGAMKALEKLEEQQSLLKKGQYSKNDFFDFLRYLVNTSPY